MFRARSIMCRWLAWGSALLLLAGFSRAADKKVLLIDSYNTGYAWSDDIIAAASKTLAGNADLKIVHMDSKKNSAEDQKIAAAQSIKSQIDDYKPDVLIACDDNACKYVIVPFYKNTSMPVVFCGINWDASKYGFPCSNVTGMLEVSVVRPLMAQLKKFAKGDRIVFLGDDNETNREEASMLQEKFNLKLDAKFVKTFEQWKAAYMDAQDNGDMLIFINYAGITDWHDAAAKQFVQDNTKIPSGSFHAFVAPFVLVTYAKLGSEQGSYAAATALKILDGASPKDFPIVGNATGKFYINSTLAQKLGVSFSPETMKVASVVGD
jgi:ABC-type uncharacterized transport system substrate-binding protein